MPDPGSSVLQNTYGDRNIVAGTGDITVGYTSEQVSALIEKIRTTFQPKLFDGRCPYMGLSAFAEKDADRFFGREKLVAELVVRVHQSRFIVITGPSGSGKSSLARAGLIHALRQGKLPGSDRWLYESLKPGRNPMEELARLASRLTRSLDAHDNIHARGLRDATVLHRLADIALRDDDDSRAVIFVDQFEEIFTQVSKEYERAPFLNLLTYAATVEKGRVMVLVAMRSDFVSNCAAYPELNRLLNQQFLQVGAMQPEELVSATALPALQVGLKIDPDLIAQIINDMKGEPGALPLMQFALKDLFDAQQKAGGIIALTLTDYLARGGIHKALERHADAEFAKLSEAEQELARTIFTHLIQVGQSQGAQDTKRMALQHELVPTGADESSVAVVIQKLADARLITTDEQEAHVRTVTISHDKLIDAWPWLHTLVDENRGAIVIQNQIAEDAQEWEKNQRDPSYLYTGARLATAREKQTEKKLALGTLAQDFVDAGIRADEEEQAQEEARRQRELEAAKSLAEEQGLRLKETRRLRYVSIAQALAAQATRQMDEFGQHERAALLARQAYLFHEANGGAVLDQIDESLRAVLTRPHFAVTLTPTSPSEGSVSCLAYSSDGLQLAVGRDSFLYLVSATGPGEWRKVFETEAYSTTAVTFGPHDDWLAWGTCEGKVCLQNLRTPQGGIIELGTDEYPVTSVAFSPDGKTLASAGGEFVRLWRLGDPGRPFAVLRSPGDETLEVSSVAFSPDGKLLVSSTSDSRIRLWNPRRPKQRPRLLKGTKIWAKAVAFGPYSLLAAAGHMLEIWDLSTDPPRGATLPAPMAETVAFSPDFRFLAVAGMQDHIELYDVSNLLRNVDDKPEILRGHTKSITQVAFAPEGARLASSSQDGTVRLWDLGTPEARPVVRPNDPDVWNSVCCVACHGDRIAASYDTGIVQLFDTIEPLQTRSQLRGDALGPVRGALPINAVAFIPNRNALVTGHNSSSGATWLWDLDQYPPRPVPLAGQKGWVGAVAVSPDGGLVASCGGDGQLCLWESSNRGVAARSAATSREDGPRTQSRSLQPNRSPRSRRR